MVLYIENPQNATQKLSELLELINRFCKVAEYKINKKKNLFNFFTLTFKWEKAMAPHSSTLAWKIPWTEEPGRLHSMGSRRVRHD